MLVDFDSIPSSSKIWIYQSAKAFSKEITASLHGHLQSFVTEWTAHGQALKASYTLLHNHFIILAVDESHYGASGCSIDSSVKAIRDIEAALALGLFDRTQIGFLNGEKIYFLPLGQLKEKYAEGMWNEGTVTFNNAITQKGQLKNEWMLPAANTWLKRYVPVKTASA